MEIKQCGVCGGLSELREVSGGHWMCSECVEESLVEDLIVEDSDGLLYGYKEDRVNWEYEREGCGK